jgi:hypothetical protein
MPVAWMSTSNTMIPAITFFLKWIKDASPGIRPKILMTDCDQAQIAALQTVYPQSRVLLCTWHVLRAMQSHFVTNQFLELWDKVKAWVKSDKMANFLNLWDEISTDPSIPQSFVQYLAKEWVPSPHMWSRVARKN